MTRYCVDHGGVIKGPAYGYPDGMRCEPCRDKYEAIHTRAEARVKGDKM